MGMIKSILQSGSSIFRPKNNFQLITVHSSLRVQVSDDLTGYKRKQISKSRQLMFQIGTPKRKGKFIQKSKEKHSFIGRIIENEKVLSSKGFTSTRVSLFTRKLSNSQNALFLLP